MNNTATILAFQAGRGEHFSLVREVAGANYGSVRLTKRLQRIVEAASKSPEKSFPEIAGSDSALEAVYRFLGNSKVTMEKTMEPHIQETCKRAMKQGVVLAIHDTTEFAFKGEVQREGLGKLRKKDEQGFLGHFALVASVVRPTLLYIWQPWPEFAPRVRSI